MGGGSGFAFYLEKVPLRDRHPKLVGLVKECVPPPMFGSDLKSWCFGSDPKVPIKKYPTTSDLGDCMVV